MAKRGETHNGRESAESLVDRLEQWLGSIVVVDCVSPYVAIGTLEKATAQYLELREADMHDLRDSSTSRENYIVKVARHGVGANRRVLVFRWDQVVGISPLDEVVTE